MTLTFCHHVYKDTGYDICPSCGKDTHETDWKFQEDLHVEWIASGKAKYEGWTSI